MNGALDKQIVLKLNKNWQPVGVTTPRDTFTKMCGGSKGERVMQAFDIQYPQLEDGTFDLNQPPEYIQLIDWDDWILLPVRECDVYITTSRMKIRVPTVVSTTEYDDMPETELSSKSLKNVFEVYGGIDAYTGKPLSLKEASRDHYIPLAKGGADDWENIRLTHTQINNKKGNRYNHEVGLPIVPPKLPGVLRACDRIRPRPIPGWSYFLKK